MEGLIAQKEDSADKRSPKQIFTIILDTAPFSEHQRAEYCWEKGHYVDQVKPLSVRLEYRYCASNSSDAKPIDIKKPIRYT